MESWLKERELGDLVQIFQKEELNFGDFPDITAPVLAGRGVKYGTALKFERAWKQYAKSLEGGDRYVEESSKYIEESSKYLESLEPKQDKLLEPKPLKSIPSEPKQLESNPKDTSKGNPDDKSMDFSQLAFYPINKHNLNEIFKRQRNVLWAPQEIDHKGDRKDWDDLDEGTRIFLTFVLCFFAQMDGLINENLIENFKRETSFYKEAKYFYTLQEYVELVHNETYSNLIEAFIRDPEEKKKAFNAIHHYPAIQGIAKLIEKWMDNSRPLMERIIAFACVEGIMFQSAFAAIYWVKKRNILSALCLANEWIARDEGMHTQFALELYRTIVQDGLFPAVSQERIHTIVNEFVEAAHVFNADALKVEMIGMNLKDMMGYVKCTADTLMAGFGAEKLYNVENKFGEMMAVIGLPNKSNFFEKTVTEYGKEDNVDFTFEFTKDY